MPMDCDGDGIIGISIGNKDASWQEYPCIVAYNNDYALIAYNEEDGVLVDKEGKTVVKGKPLDIGQSHRPRLHGVDMWAVRLEKTKLHNINKIWRDRYPQYLKGQLLPKGEVNKNGGYRYE